MKNSFEVGSIDHVEMFVPGRYEAAEWYDRVLGLKIISGFEHWAEDPGGPLMISSDGGATKLALFRGQSPGERETVGFHRVAFRVTGEAFNSFLDLLEDQQLSDHLGRRVTRDLVADHDKSFSVYFHDPYGHRLEITTYDYDNVADSLARSKTSLWP